MQLRTVVALGAMALGAGCTHGLGTRSPAPDEAALARSVTIVRDEWGVPHIYGPTDASVAFGAAFAQAEDDYWQIEEDYIHALGRAAHYYGERYLAADLVRAAFEVERLSREEYAREPQTQRAVWDAYAAGLNYYLRVSGLAPRLITRWEPWMLFARVRHVTAGMVFDGIELGTAGESGGMQLTGAAAADSTHCPGTRPDSGPCAARAHVSRALAVSPARSASGHALLLRSPHAPFSGQGQLYELHLHSDAGWHVSGFALLGTPVPSSAHNEWLGWSHTAADTDIADVYAVRFDQPADPLAYRMDGAWQQAVAWHDTLHVNTMQGVVTRAFRFRRTEHGPVVAMHNGRALALRIARMTEGGALQQWLAMGRARTLDEFQAALAQRALTVSTTYADAAGNIYHVHGNAVPVRDSSFDWSAPVDGNTARTRWLGYRVVGDLPQQLNPPAGLLAAGSPSLPAALERRNAGADAAFPAPAAITPDMLMQAAFDTQLEDTAPGIAALVAEWEDVGGHNPQRAMELDEALELLRAWDGRATIESAATTLYIMWQERRRDGGYDGSFGRLRAMEDVVLSLRRDWGSARVPWGELNRLQRVPAGADRPASDSAESLPIAGVPAWTGAAFALESAPAGEGRRRHGVSGMAVGVVEFGAPLRARSVHPLGQSADPASPVFFDQAVLYARGELKPAWFERVDVQNHARRTYRPAESVTVPARRP